MLKKGISSIALFLLALGIISQGSVFGATVTVDQGGGGDFTTITDAINFANGNAGADTIQILDTATYSEDIPEITEELTIETVGNISPVLEKSSGANGAISFQPASTTGSLIIQGTDASNKLTIRRAVGSDDAVSPGDGEHQGNIVLSNVVLDAGTTTGTLFGATNTSSVLQAYSLSGVDFVGGDSADVSVAMSLAASGGMTANVDNCDFSGLTSIGTRIQTSGPTTSTINISNCNVTNSFSFGTPIGGFIVSLQGSAVVNIDNCDFSGGALANNFYGVFGVNNSPQVTVSNSDCRLGSNGQRMVNFDDPGCSITFNNCNMRFNAGAIGTTFNGAANGTYTFNDCDFGGVGGASNQSLVSGNGGDNEGTYIFNSPVFTDGVGFIALNLEAGMSVTLRGTSPTQKLDLDPLIDPTFAGTGAIVFARFGFAGRGGGTLILEDCTGSLNTFFNYFDTFDTLLEDVNLVMNRCEWSGDGADARFAPGGGAFGINVTATNTIWGLDSTPVIDHMIALFGNNTSTGTITLDHCTFFGATNQTMLNTFDQGGSGRVDVLVSNNSLYNDSEGQGIAGAFNVGTGNLSGAGNIFTQEGSVAPGGFFGGEPVGFGTVTGSGALGLDATGRITNGFSVAVNSAVGSTLLVDVDGEVRPQQGIADVGADESGFETQVIGLTTGVQNWNMFY